MPGSNTNQLYRDSQVYTWPYDEEHQELSFNIKDRVANITGAPISDLEFLQTQRYLATSKGWYGAHFDNAVCTRTYTTLRACVGAVCAAFKPLGRGTVRRLSATTRSEIVARCVRELAEKGGVYPFSNRVVKQGTAARTHGLLP